jgi:glycine oxidase
MSASPDVLVIGGGVIGLSCAYFLAREGKRVTILERGEPGREASWAGAGIIPPGNPSGARQPYDRLRAESSAMFGPMSEQLRELTGVDNGYRVCGGIEFLDPQDEPIVTAWRVEGIECHRLSRTIRMSLEPAVINPGNVAAFQLPQLAQVRNPRYVAALVVACRRVGVSLLANTRVKDLDCRQGRVAGVRLQSGESLSAGQFLVAGGAWSDDLLAPIGYRPGIRPIRGQIVLLKLPAPLFGHVLSYGKQYLVPRDDGRVLVGSTEEDVGFEKQTTAAAVEGLIALARSFVPKLSDAAVEQCWAGLRPGSPDGMPFLGRIPGCDNAFVASGHFRAGIQLSPITARLMTDLMLGRTPSMPVEAFRPDRDTSVPVQPAFRS